MSGFKLIGLIPLKGCSKKFLKNLSIGEKYCFYQDFEVVVNKDKGSVDSVIRSSNSLNTEIVSLYNNPDEINISISALVGENGSGKSSLIELLYYTIYMIGTKYKKSNNKLGESIIELAELKINNELSQARKFKRSWNVKSILGDDKEYLLARIIKRYGIDITFKDEKESLNQFIDTKLKERVVAIQRRKTAAKKIEKEINSKLNVAILYEADKIYCVQIKNGKFAHFVFEDGVKSEAKSFDGFNLEDFFYSISVNYSHHSLNSNSLGEWINALFHKNDGYQTPVVINPMRDRGNFNVNHEIKLLKERLIGNVTYNLYKNPKYKLLDKYRFEKFIFTPKLNTGDELVGIKPYEFGSSYFLKDPIGRILHCKNVVEFRNDRITERAIAYLDKKVFRIPEQYPFLFKEEITRENCEELITFVNKDDSHITKKIYQTIFFLARYGETDKLKSLWATNSAGQIILSADDMSMWLESFNKTIREIEGGGKSVSPYDFSLFSLPGFMNIDFEITDTEKHKTFKLSELSSGEQQIILNLSSISYHLGNIQSVHSSRTKRIKYRNVNILLDEIELYYHPNSQRKMVKELISSIRDTSLEEKGIQSVNILFSTHSPFVLSDIPSRNVLRLIEGKPEPQKEQTFGANIHEILSNDFFLKSGFMGQFAKEKIEEVLEFINSSELNTEPEEIKRVKNIVDIIGEPIVKTRLLQLFNEKYPAFADDRDEIQTRINKQRELLKKLEGQIKKGSDEKNR